MIFCKRCYIGNQLVPLCQMLGSTNGIGNLLHTFGNTGQGIKIVEFAHKNHLAAAMLHYLLELLGGKVRVERYRYIAGHHNGDVGDNPMGTVFRDNPDVTHRWQAERLQVSGHFACLATYFGVGVFLPSTARGLAQIYLVGAVFFPMIKFLGDGLQSFFLDFGHLFGAGNDAAHGFGVLS